MFKSIIRHVILMLVALSVLTGVLCVLSSAAIAQYNPEVDGNSIIENYVMTLDSRTLSHTDTAESTISESASPMTNLTVENGAIVTLDASKSYDWANYTINGYGEWTTVTGVTELAGVSGLVAVRNSGVDGYSAGAPQILYVAGENVGSISWNRYQSTGFVEGAWTTSNNESTKDFNYTLGFATYRIAGGYIMPSGTALINWNYKYAFTNDEIMPIQDFGAIRMNFAFGIKWPVTGALGYKIVFHVAEGLRDTYVVEGYYNRARTNILITPESVLPDEETGFLVGITLYPLADRPGNTTSLHWNTPSLFSSDLYLLEGQEIGVNNKNTDTVYTNDDRVRIDIGSATAPNELYTQTIENGYYTGVKVVGFDAEKTYQVAINNRDLLTLADGVTEYVLPANSTVAFRYAATDDTRASEWVVFTNGSLVPAFGHITDTEYRDTYGADALIPGYWTTNSTLVEPWEKNGNYTTSKINTSQDLGAVKYRYTFTEDEQFVIDDRAWFIYDWNAQPTNMGMPECYNPEWEASVDIYVAGEDTPYTITGSWKGYQIVNEISPNAIIVNLVDEFPEIAGKTVTGFVIRPYSNLTGKTPQTYKPEDTTNNAYIHHRLISVGFHDTYSNISAVRNNIRVNTLTGISAQTDVIYALGATAQASDFEIYEVYSDGQTAQISSSRATVSTPENFATESGIYTVTLTVGDISTTVDVTVEALPEIRVTGLTLLYADLIQIRYKFAITGEGIAERGMYVFNSAEDAATHDAEKASQIQVVEQKSGQYYGYTDGIPAKKMGDSQFVVGYVKTESGRYIYADMVEYSPKIYAANMVGKSSTSEETKALCNALMNYGAAAQTHFNYNTSNLMNVGFDTVEYDESVLGEEIFSVDTTQINGFTVNSATLLFEGAITYRFKYTPSAEIADNTLYAQYTVKGETNSVELVLESGEYYAYISGIAAKDMDEALTVIPYYIDESEEKVYGPELVYSGYEYVRRTLNVSTSDTMKALAKAFAMYIDAANTALS